MARKRIDLLLVERGVVDSRVKARAAVEAGLVTVNGKVITKPADTVDQHAQIIAEAAHPWVGRGALKLLHALDLWPVVVEGRVALDVGASTGGFTEVLLSRGAERVFAVDVGRDQLHAKLRDDPRVIDLSGVDARVLDETVISIAPTLVVSDVSFIALTKALPMALALAAPGADLVALIKPQFEAGRDFVGKGGLVKDPEIIARCEREVVEFLEASGWTVNGLTESPITGGDGQVERLVWATKA
ncbi:TlyA family RNA methyltransferase [Caulobacter sp. FWC2]|uniref:TlyA family RNA methyltransferase n=1 Tax=Caulobacter sp. FWC2 TaxID=69664 RepID=UPI000C15B358|nr:TlyA family RNA methyltransferase [Caulobacter sp. FWC2]PIB92684.1 TlyA family rRNA (cytidine-2'-O)-methyltransferase [Caulobacter sp. FWC2]